jgi:hypothetical protein
LESRPRRRRRSYDYLSIHQHFDSIAQLDSIPYTDRGFFDAIVAYASKNLTPDAGACGPCNDQICYDLLVKSGAITDPAKCGNNKACVECTDELGCSEGHDPVWTGSGGTPSDQCVCPGDPAQCELKNCCAKGTVWNPASCACE